MHRIVFFGTPIFVLPVPETLRKMPGAQLVAVVTTPDKPADRGHVTSSSPIKQWAKEHGIAVLQPERFDAACIDSLKKLRPTVGVMAAYGKLLPKDVLDIFPRSIVNIHPSLLPKWRGPSPVQAALIAGDTETGVTLIVTDDEMDHGPILAQETMPLKGGETADALLTELFKRGVNLLSKTLFPWIHGEVEPEAQAHSLATYSKLLHRKDGLIDWNHSCDEIIRRIRAYHPWPSAFIKLPDMTRLKIINVSPFKLEQKAPTAMVTRGPAGEFLVRANNGWIQVAEVQLTGKTPIRGDAFLRGRTELVGKVLG